MEHTTPSSMNGLVDTGRMNHLYPYQLIICQVAHLDHPYLWLSLPNTSYLALVPEAHLNAACSLFFFRLRHHPFQDFFNLKIVGSNSIYCTVICDY